MPETGLIPDVLPDILPDILPVPDILPDIILDEDARAILLEAARRTGRSPNYVVILAVSAFLGYSSAFAAALSATAPRKPVTRTSGSFMVGDTLLPPPTSPRPVKTKVLVNGPHAFEIRECAVTLTPSKDLISACLELQHVERGTMFDLTITDAAAWTKIVRMCSALISVSQITDPSQLIGCQLDFVCSNGKPIRLPK
jgi:hypothetical protein